MTAEHAIGTGQVAGHLAPHLETPAEWMTRCEGLRKRWEGT